MESGGHIKTGTDIGDYRITRVIGRGGFGITYEAWDRSLDRQVAIKEYFPHGAASREEDGTTVTCPMHSADGFAKGLERFLDEAKVLARFQDPRIVRVNGFLKAHNTAYMIMDFERGTLLRDVVAQRGSLPPVEAKSLLIDLLEALQIVHAGNYLHRDIKPNNLMCRPDGRVVLLDFGSARLAQDITGKNLTVVVTPGYAPLEQYDGDSQQGPPTDLYATGATLLHCLTGTHPPDGFKRSLAIQMGNPDPVRVLLDGIAARDAVGAELATLLEWMLKPYAADRPAQAQAVLDRLRGEQPSRVTVAVPAVDPLQAMRSIPSAQVEPMRAFLATLVGEQATPMILGSVRGSRNAADFIERIAAKIPDAALRPQASDGLRRILSGGAPTISVPLPPPQAAKPITAKPASAAPADEHTSKLLAGELAKYIGPIASLLVKKRVAKAASRSELIAQLADEISTPAERAAFLAAVRSLPGFAD